MEEQQEGAKSMNAEKLMHKKKRRCSRGVVKSGPRKGRCKKHR